MGALWSGYGFFSLSNQVGYIANDGTVWSGWGEYLGDRIGHVDDDNRAYNLYGACIGHVDDDGVVWNSMTDTYGNMVAFISEDGTVWSGISNYSGERLGYVDSDRKKSGLALLMVLGRL